MISLNDILAGTLSLLEKQAIFHDIELVRYLDSSLPLVMADASQMQQVFMNIILNAVDAMDEKGAPDAQDLERLRKRPGSSHGKHQGHRLRHSGGYHQPYLRSLLHHQGGGAGHGLGTGHRLRYCYPSTTA